MYYYIPVKLIKMVQYRKVKTTILQPYLRALNLTVLNPSCRQEESYTILLRLAQLFNKGRVRITGKGRVILSVTREIS